MKLDLDPKINRLDKIEETRKSVYLFLTKPNGFLFFYWQQTLCEKCIKYGVISGPYFPVFGLNTGKYRPEITPQFDTFHAVNLPSDLRFILC